MVQTSVITGDGPKVVAPLLSKESVGELMRKMQRRMGSMSGDVCMVFEREALRRDDRLKDCGVGHGSTIHMKKVA